MPAVPEIGLNILPRRIAVIAGGGDMPARLIAACDRQGIETFIVSLTGHADIGLPQSGNHFSARPGAAGRIIARLRQEGIADIVLIGSVRRPSVAELWPDLWTARFMLRNSMRALGDDSLLQAIRRDLEKEGFRIWGVQDFMGDALALPGNLARQRPDGQALADINLGAAAARTLGTLDIGQSVIVQEGLVLGVEAIEGTDELIRRCAGYKRQGRGAILIKRAKPQQDRNLDLPTIGPQTIRLCGEAGMAGVAVEAGGCLIIDRAEVISIADKAGLFLIATDFADA